ncbi:MAG TPA: hypothetical protein VIV60_27235, partial [Polyangiaceae bacterium]
MNSWRFAAIALLGGAVCFGCSSASGSGSGTTGRAITLKTRLAIQDDLTQPKTNALGWTIVVSKAYLSVGALYYYSGDP